ncbi:peptidase [candidate division GN15 bacterium]|uniref:Peptidase n=1 Tax=candidate division GN15 bacterium TaxID=2072418 RepID=A0A855X3S6_9BACT|nr:MAG: peptidase [candidate division GN15 bacterium]
MIKVGRNSAAVNRLWRGRRECCQVGNIRKFGESSDTPIRYKSKIPRPVTTFRLTAESGLGILQGSTTWRNSLDEHVSRHNRFSITGLRLVAVLGGALACVVVGLIISANLQMPPKTQAQGNVNSAQFAAYPVVERNGEYESPFVSVVEKVQSAVVNVSARSQNRQTPWFFHDWGSYSVSSGSGFFFRDDGYILTNNHVVKDSRELLVRTAAGYEYDAKLVGSDPQTDLAVLKIEPQEKITSIPFGDSDALKVGDWAIAIGNPFPQQGLDRTVTVGVISAKGRNNLGFGDETPQYQNYIQTDASINPGNSGGPLLNLRGECIGVNSAIYGPNGTSVGIGFAIPINIARAVVPDLIATGTVTRGWLGVWLSPTGVTERDAKRLGLAAVKGVKVDSTFPGSPAAQAGIADGDVIVEFNNNEVDDQSQFSSLVATVRHDQTVPIALVRDGKRINIDVTLADRDKFLASLPAAARTRTATPQQWLGMEFTDFTPEIARQIGIKHIDGVYVTRVYPGSQADRASIGEGTIIMQVNNQAVTSVTDLELVARRIPDDVRIPLIVQEPDGSIARKMIRP